MTLEFRWYSPIPLTSEQSGTEEDLNGAVALCASMAYGQEEGWEYEGYVRNVERVLERGSGIGRNGADFAICITPTSSITSSYPPRSHTHAPYLKSIRDRAFSASHQVVAMIGVLWTTSFYEYDDGSKGTEVEVGRIPWVACRRNWRRTVCTGEGNEKDVMSTLFKMLHQKCMERGVAFNMLIGIPNYYRRHGFEYAYNFGPLLLTPLPIKDTLYTPALTSRLGLPPDGQHLFELHESPCTSSRQWFSSRYIGDMIAWNVGVRNTDDWKAIDKKEDGFKVPRDRMSVPIVLEKDGEVVAAISMSRPNPGEELKSAMISRVSIWEKYATPAMIEQVGQEIVVHAIRWANDLLKEEVRFDEELSKKYQEILGLEHSELSESAQNVDPESMNIDHLVWGLSSGYPFATWLREHDQAFAIPQGGSHPSLCMQWVNIPSLFIFCKALEPTFNIRLSKSHIFNYDTQERESHAHFYTLRICSWDTSKSGVEIVVSGMNKHVVSISERHFRRDQLPLRGFDSEKVNVLGPWGSIIQLLMGYKPFQILKDVVPDFLVDDKMLSLLSVLFPISQPDCHIYF